MPKNGDIKRSKAEKCGESVVRSRAKWMFWAEEPQMD